MEGVLNHVTCHGHGNGAGKIPLQLQLVLMETMAMRGLVFHRIGLGQAHHQLSARLLYDSSPIPVSPVLSVVSVLSLF